MSNITRAPSREQILDLQSAMFASGAVKPQKVEHLFGPGLYVRALHLDAGDTIVGKVHATEHIFMVTRGEITLTAEGMAPVTVKAPYQCVAKPGMKRVGHAHTDCVCVNVHITEERDLEKLEGLLIIPEALPAPVVYQEIES